MSNVLLFPKKPLQRVNESAAMEPYEFSCEELAVLCRWYSAMKFAFPRLQGVMTVCREDRVSAIGLYGDDGCSPNCLISKHETDGQIILLWATDHDRPRTIGTIREITDAQILAIAPPRDQASWLDLSGWMKILSERTAGDLSEALSQNSHPA